MDYDAYRLHREYCAQRQAAEPFVEKLVELEMAQPVRFMIHGDGSLEKETLWSDAAEKYRDDLKSAIDWQMRKFTKAV